MSGRRHGCDKADDWIGFLKTTIRNGTVSNTFENNSYENNSRHEIHLAVFVIFILHLFSFNSAYLIVFIFSNH